MHVKVNDVISTDLSMISVVDHSDEKWKVKWHLLGEIMI